MNWSTSAESCHSQSPPQLVTDARIPRPRWIELSRCGIWPLRGVRMGHCRLCFSHSLLEKSQVEGKHLGELTFTWWGRGGGAGGEPAHLELGEWSLIFPPWPHTGAFPPLGKCHTAALPRVRKGEAVPTPLEAGTASHMWRETSDHLCSQQHHNHRSSFVLLRTPWPIDFFCRSSNALFT